MTALGVTFVLAGLVTNVTVSVARSRDRRTSEGHCLVAISVS
jgi:uncharacterized membrane protein YhaH (DUF805 family)